MSDAKFPSIRHVLTTTLVAISLAACSGSATSTFPKAQTAYEQGDYNTARVHLMNVLAEDKSNAEANLLYARTMLALGDGVTSKAALDRLPAKLSDDAEVKSLMAHALILQGAPRAAISMLGEPDANTTERSYQMLAWAYLQNNMLAKGRDVLAKGMEKFPDSADMKVLAAEFDVASNDLDSASMNALEAWRVKPDHYDALMLNGRFALFNDNLPDASKYYQLAHEASPARVAPLVNLSGIAIDRKNIKSAKKYLAQAREIDAKDPLVSFIEARLAFEAGDASRAQKILQQSESELTSFPGALQLSGAVAYELGQYEYAINRLRRYRTERPKDMVAARKLVSAYRKVGDEFSANALEAELAAAGA